MTVLIGPLVSLSFVIHFPIDERSLHFHDANFVTLRLFVQEKVKTISFGEATLAVVHMYSQHYE